MLAKTKDRCDFLDSIKVLYSETILCNFQFCVSGTFPIWRSSPHFPYRVARRTKVNESLAEKMLLMTALIMDRVLSR